jgi:ferredoxin
MKVTVDLKKCIKAGECYYNHPALLKVNKDTGYPDVQMAELSTEELIREAQEAAEVCPAQAITVVE